MLISFVTLGTAGCGAGDGEEEDEESDCFFLFFFPSPFAIIEMLATWLVLPGVEENIIMLRGEEKGEVALEVCS